MSKGLKRESGFTLIELVLVIAIAALLMVIVFMAVSGAQRARRDTQRKADAARYLAAAEQYASNNGGKYPTASIVGTYLTNGGGTFSDPGTGAAYGITVGTGAPGAAGAISAATNATCAGTPAVITGGGTLRQFAVSVYQENGGQYCVSNQ